jgi:2-alkyl-3-oxoalkanoate reductase
MKVLVTGGTGFLGNGVVRALLKKGHSALSFSRGDSPDLRDLGAMVIRGDISDGEAFAQALEGCDALIHVAAKPGIWGTYQDYYRVNVTGTENALEACRFQGVKILVYTSSPSVIFENAHQSGTNESAGYPESFLAHYPKTKAMAEQMVLKASSADLATVSLRPHLIWGPGDPHFIPRLIERARAGTLRIVGDGKNMVDSVYIDNAVDAHLLALERLSPGSPLAGKAYFITNGEPLPMADLMNRFLGAAGLPPVTKKIPAGLAYTAGALMEFAYTLLKRAEEPKMTRFLARELSCAHWYDISAARRDLGYEPGISIGEGMKRLSSWLRKQNMAERASQ